MIKGEESEQNRPFSLFFLKNLKSGAGLMLKIDLETYDSLQLFLLQECDRMELHKRTKYLAKTYFDTAATQLLQITSQNAPLYLLTSILLAVKFNESRAISDLITVGDLVNVSEGRFQHAEFIEAQLQLLKLLRFRLHFNSPYELAPNFTQIIAKYPHKKARQAKLEIIIDFALTLPCLMLMAAQELYLACFLMIFSGVLEEGDRELVMRDVNDGCMVGQIRRQIERGLGESGHCAQNQKT